MIQARTGSRRLPGKVLADIDGRPMLAYMLARLAPLTAVRTVIATTAAASDEPIAAIAAAAGIPVVFGPEDDVLARYRTALEAFPADTVIRLTADCPLADPELVTAVLARHRQTGADYTSNVFPRTFPRGLDVEVMRAEALRVAADEAGTREEREHVTPFLYRRPERFRLANLRAEADFSAARWTVDLPEDLDHVRSLVAAAAGRTLGWREIWALDPTAGQPSDQLRLRPAWAADSPLFLALRNDPDAVRFSPGGSPVPAETHEPWFAAALEDPSWRLLVAEEAGAAVGYLRAKVHDGRGEVSIAVDPGRRGRGLATRILQAFQAQIGPDQQIRELRARIRRDNPASLAAFGRAGFSVHKEMQGQVEMGWTPG